MSGKQRRKATANDNYIRSSNNLAQSETYLKVWSPLTGLVEEPADNSYYDFSQCVTEQTGSWKPGAKTKSPQAPVEYQAMDGVP